MQVDELLKLRNKIHESFTSMPGLLMKTSSNDKLKGVSANFLTKEAEISDQNEEQEYPMGDSTPNKPNKRKWLNLNFRTNHFPC